MRVSKIDTELCIKVMDQLHWFRAPERVSYKLCTLVYVSLYRVALSHLAQLYVSIFTDACRSHIRSADKTELKVSRHKPSINGPCSFGIAGPTAWSSLPVYIRILSNKKLLYGQFSCGLATFLFSISCGLWLYLAQMRYTASMPEHIFQMSFLLTKGFHPFIYVFIYLLLIDIWVYNNT